MRSVKVAYSLFGLICGVSFSGSACRVMGVKIGRQGISQKWLGRSWTNLVCVWIPSSDVYCTANGRVISACVHVRTCSCTPPFRISGTTGRIALKFGECLETYWLDKGGGVHPHVRTPFPYHWNGWTDWAEIWCVVRDTLAMRFAQVSGGVNLHLCTCTPLFHITGTGGCIMLKYGELINPLTRRFTQLIGTGYLRVCTFNYISFSSTSIRFPRSSPKSRLTGYEWSAKRGTGSPWLSGKIWVWAARHGPTRHDTTPWYFWRANISAATGPIDKRSSLMGSYIPSTVDGTNTHPSG